MRKDSCGGGAGVVGGEKSINVFFTGDENMLVIKTSPFLVPVNEPLLLNISLFRLDTGSIVYFMIGTIVKRRCLGTVNTVLAQEQARGKLSTELTSPLQKANEALRFQLASAAPSCQCPALPNPAEKICVSAGRLLWSMTRQCLSAA